jgi:serine/threonine protein kinase
VKHDDTFFIVNEGIQQHMYQILTSYNVCKTISLLFNRSDDEESESEDDDPPKTSVVDIDRFSLSQIYSARILNENHRRLIWLAKVHLDRTVSLQIVIKDYLPNKDLDLYKQHRTNEFKSHSRQRTIIDQDEFCFEFSSRTHLEYAHESRLLLKEFKYHPLIVHTFICDNDPKKDLRIFMEYLPCGNLHSYLSRLKSNSNDPLMNAFHWIYQLGQVMAYLSKKEIVHRDLATRNILLKDEQHIKLSDFGLSRYEGVIPEGKDYILPPRWTAPEGFVRNQKIVSSSDVWSFGVVIWEIYSFGDVPYDVEINNDTHQLVRLLKRFLVEQGRRLSRPTSCSESMYDLMCRCWNGDVDKRPGFVDIINDLNGVSTRKDRIIPFTYEERKSWKKAKEEYLLISRPTQIFSNDGDNYVTVEDNENDDKENITTSL